LKINLIPDNKYLIGYLSDGDIEKLLPKEWKKSIIIMPDASSQTIFAQILRIGRRTTSKDVECPSFCQIGDIVIIPRKDKVENTQVLTRVNDVNCILIDQEHVVGKVLL